MKVHVSPSLLATEEGEAIHRVSEFGSMVKSFHIDVMDNQFVPNYTLDRFSPPFVSSMKTKAEKHVHLMTELPSKYYNAYFEAGADLILFHHETVKNPTIELQAIRNFGIKAGVSIKPGTPASVLEDYIHRVDCVLVMTVEPGFGGQSFMEDMLPKISEIRKKHPAIDIAVDGGINFETGKKCVDAGANILVAGSSIFGKENPKKALEELKKLEK